MISFCPTHFLIINFNSDDLLESKTGVSARMRRSRRTLKIFPSCGKIIGGCDFLLDQTMDVRTAIVLFVVSECDIATMCDNVTK